MEEFKKDVIGFVTTYGGKIVLALLVLIIGSLVVKGLAKAAGKAVEKSKLDGTVKVLLKKLIKILLYVVLFISVIEILGVPMSSVLAILASCGLAVGLALQGSLGNLVGGLMILLFRPFKIGDYIETGGSEGNVTDISIFYTTVMTLDNKQIFVPNGELMNGSIVNYTAAAKRRIDLEFKITNDIDEDLVKGVLLTAARETEGVLRDPAAFARLGAVDDDTYIFYVRIWCETARYWDVYFDLIENCSKALTENDIDDPEERIAVRIVKDEE
jgi:small conductance mechanosensitive channel